MLDRDVIRGIETQLRSSMCLVEPQSLELSLLPPRHYFIWMLESGDGSGEPNVGTLIWDKGASTSYLNPKLKHSLMFLTQIDLGEEIHQLIVTKDLIFQITSLIRL